MFTKVFGSVLLALVLLLGATPRATASSLTVGGDATGDWVVVTARILGEGEASWGWQAEIGRDARPLVWGTVAAITVDGERFPAWHHAWHLGENRHEVTTTEDAGGARLTLTEGEPGYGWIGSSAGAFGFSEGDTFTTATYMPGASFSSLTANPPVNAEVEITIGSGSGLVIADESSSGVGAHVLGSSAGDFTVRQPVPAGALGIVLECGQCRSEWASPNGDAGGRVDAFAVSLDDPIAGGPPDFVAPLDSTGDWTFRMRGAEVDPLAGRQVLASYVDLGSLRSLFI